MDKMKRLLVIAAVAVVAVAIVVRVAGLKKVVFGTAWDTMVGTGTTV